jgi:hypothetical protein
MDLYAPGVRSAYRNVRQRDTGFDQYLGVAPMSNYSVLAAKAAC